VGGKGGGGGRGRNEHMNNKRKRKKKKKNKGKKKKAQVPRISLVSPPAPELLNQSTRFVICIKFLQQQNIA
jgi:hypothetical protein